MEEVQSLVQHARDSQANTQQRNAAFGKLVNRFQDMAYGCAYSRLGDFHLAEDAAQEAFIVAYQDLKKLENPQAFPGWFKRVVVGQCDRMTRGRRVAVQAMDSALELPSSEPDPAMMVEQQERRTLVHDAIATLPDNQRDVVSLFYIGEHSQKEIADFLEVPANTVKKRLQHARSNLKERMLDMVKDSLHSNAPSRDDSFQKRVLRMVQPVSMKTEYYGYGVEQVNGNDGWALMKASFAGDIDEVRRLLDKDPRLVNVQFWYQFPIHWAVREGHTDIVALLLESGAEPGQSLAMYNAWDKLLIAAEERGHTDVKELLENEMKNRFNYDPAFDDLKEAIIAGDRARIDAVLSDNPGLATAADAFGSNAIHWTVMTRRIDLIDYFLERGADIEAKRADGRTPLLLSLDTDYWFGHRVRDEGLRLPFERSQNVVTGYLLARGAAYPFAVAAGLGDQERVEALLTEDPGLAVRRDIFGGAPLHHAVGSGSVHLVKLLLDHGADPNMHEAGAPDGGALFAACCDNNLEMAKLLLEAGANPNAEVDSSGSCLTIVEFNHPHNCKEMQDLLRSYGAVDAGWQLETEDHKQELQKNPMRARDLNYLPFLVDKADGALIDMVHDLEPEIFAELRSGDQWTGGVAPENTAVLKKLLDYGMNADNPNWIGKSLLHIYAERDNREAVDLVLAAGADINALELEDGSTPLASAARNGHEDMVRYLLEKGADPNAPAGSPWATPLAAAERAGQSGVTEILRQQGT